MWVLLRVYVNHIMCPHRILPNLPRFPQKAGNKSTRHRLCPTRRERRRRECLVHNSRKSACSSWRVRFRHCGDLVSIVLRGLLFVSIVSGLQLLCICCGYFLAMIAMSVCWAPAGIARAVRVGSSSIAWVAWAGGFASGIAVRVACRVTGVALESTMFWAIVDAFLLMNVTGVLIRLMIVWKRCE